MLFCSELKTQVLHFTSLSIFELNRSQVDSKPVQNACFSSLLCFLLLWDLHTALPTLTPCCC